MATGQKRTGKFLKKPVFDLPHPLPPGQERCKQFPFHGPEELDISLGLPWGIDIVTGQIEPYIIMTAQTLPQRQSF